MYIYITRDDAGLVPRGRASSREGAASHAAGDPAAANGGRRRRRAPAPPSEAARPRPRPSPGWSGAPILEKRDCPVQLVGREPVGVGVLDERNAPRGQRPVPGGQRVRNRKG